MDEKHPLEVDLDVGYVHTRRDTRITRENLQNDPATGGQNIVLVDELQMSESVDELQLRIGIGLWHDLEIHLVVPVVLGDTQSWDYATVNGASVGAASTLANNKLDISGPACKPVPPAVSCPIVIAPGGSKRAGLRDPTIGIAWGPINEEREVRLHPDLFPPGKPVSTWVIGFDYTLPLPGDADDPSKFGLNATPGSAAASTSHPVIRKAHVFSLWTAFSKRYKVLDPYVKLQVSVPLAVKGSAPGEGSYDNCWHPETLADVAQAQPGTTFLGNCADAAWKGETGYKPPVSAGFSIGTELVAAEDETAQRKLAFDLRGDATWFGPGRDYTQVTDALGKLTYTDERVALVGSLGLYGRIARWFHVRVAGTLGVETPHFLTSESIGKDLNGDGKVDVASANPSLKPEQNPTYDFRLDQVGRRLRAEPSVTWGLSSYLSLNF